jgi:hypothetical protein
MERLRWKVAGGPRERAAANHRFPTLRTCASRRFRADSPSSSVGFLLAARLCRPSGLELRRLVMYVIHHSHESHMVEGARQPVK